MSRASEAHAEAPTRARGMRGITPAAGGGTHRRRRAAGDIADRHTRDTVRQLVCGSRSSAPHAPQTCSIRCSFVEYLY